MPSIGALSPKNNTAFSEAGGGCSQQKKSKVEKSTEQNFVSFPSARRQSDKDTYTTIMSAYVQDCMTAQRARADLL